MYADDHAIVGGLARLDGRPIVLIGHQKGRDTKERCAATTACQARGLPQGAAG